MTLRDFSRLSEAGKDEMVQLWGDCVAEEVLPGLQVRLYKLDNFYVEVYYDHKANKIKRYKGCLYSDLLRQQIN